MKKPFFSVIIPTYNRKDFLRIAIDSVLSQTFHNYELIIVDDGSDDGTKEIMDDERNTKDAENKIKYLHQTHQGVSQARNTGITAADGEFICFLDSDDRFRQDKLKITHQYTKKYPDYKIFHTEEIWYRNGEYLPQKEHHKKPFGWVFENSVKLCSIGLSTTAINKTIFKKIGLFDKDFPACEDYDFWLRATPKFPVYLIPEYLTIKEGGRSDQLSRKYPAMDTFRIYALKKVIKSGILSKKEYDMALSELKKKSEIYIKGAQKRGRLEEVNLCKKLIQELDNEPHRQ
ncbi:MAG: glycosyltransferase family A protein [Candidatus Omnitrophota bacterium]|jgi:glycosyltransferase involved in cell wall biosynthesis